MPACFVGAPEGAVALRKESVDRNRTAVRSYEVD